MKFVIFASLIASALAVPAELTPRTGPYRCPGHYSILQCCASDVGSVIGVNCDSPTRDPRDAKEFQAICAAKGQQAKCCVIPVLGQGLLCTNAV